MHKLILVFLLLFNAVAMADIPDKAMLDELRSYLQKAPECLPACAAIEDMHISINDKMSIDFSVNSLQRIAIPLPSQKNQFWPSVITLDNGEMAFTYKDGKNGLWILLNKGSHKVHMEAYIQSLNSINIPLPLVPAHVTVDAEDFAVSGIDDNLVPESQIQFTRKQKTQSSNLSTASSAQALSPLIQVNRRLILGIEWEMETQVRRLSPQGTPISINIPLITGESVNTANIQVKNNQVNVIMRPNQSVVSWRSKLAIVGNIELNAPRHGWFEHWSLQASPVWHIDYSANTLNPIHHQQQGMWIPSWSPWPGEKLTIQVSKPAGTKGNTLTINSSTATTRVGKRWDQTELQVSLRSSQGTQHNIQLPEQAQLQSVSIDGVKKPIQQQGLQVTLPIHPGAQQLLLKWKQENTLSSIYHAPVIDLGSTTVNHTTKVILPRDRWILFTNGPLLGPAVLFWGVLISIILISFALFRLQLAPLSYFDWLLLGIGMSQAGIMAGIIVIGWLFVLGIRHKLPDNTSTTQHNMLQIGIVLLTWMALVALFEAVSQGLLGLPQMQISGNQSTAYQLNWYQDIVGQTTPDSRIISLPLYIYRGLSLLWSLWLAYSLLKWFKWGWQGFTRTAIWRSINLPAIKSNSK